MTTISLQELSPHAADIIQRALAGNEEVFITNDKEEHLARVVSISPVTSQISDNPLRKGGFAKGKLTILDNWDSSEVNNEIAREFGALD